MVLGQSQDTLLLQKEDKKTLLPFCYYMEAAIQKQLNLSSVLVRGSKLACRGEKEKAIWDIFPSKNSSHEFLENIVTREVAATATAAIITTTTTTTANTIAASPD